MTERVEFTYDSRDGETRIHAVKWIPSEETLVDGKPYCVVQIVHGMQEYAMRYDDFASFLASHGILVVGNDHLGHGMSIKEGNPLGYMCSQDPATVLVRDVHRLKKLTQKEYPGVPYIIIGHSMGSYVLRNYLTRYGTGIDGAVLMGTGFEKASTTTVSAFAAKILEIFQGAKHPSQFMENTGFKAYMTHIEHPRTNKDWITRDEKMVEDYISNPLCNFTFTINGFETLLELVKRAQDVKKMKEIPKKLPILIVSGTEDPVGAWGEGPSKLYDLYLNLDLTKTQLKLYNGARHEVLNEIDRETTYRDILNWVSNVVDCMQMN